MNFKKYLIIGLHAILISIKYLFILLVIAFILILLLIGNSYKNLKIATSSGLAAKTALTNATNAAKTKNWTESLKDAEQAQLNFSVALSALDFSQKNPGIYNLKPIASQINDLKYLLKTGEILSRSLVNVLPIVQKLDDIRSGANSNNFANLSTDDKSSFLRLVYASEPELNGLKANITLASLNLNKIHKIGILWPIYSQISDIKQELDQVSSTITKFSPLIKLLPALAGEPNASNFLLILQNNDELRPTGGFIGVYGILNIKNGTIISLKTDDSYHLDMPASLKSEWNLEPPAILKKYLKVSKWYLRDANWSPDWPQSAQKINEIYQGESRAIDQKEENFTGIIAITPDLVADLIKLVGPITVQGTTYDSTNFQPLLQYNVEVAYKDQDISSWDRKNIINELVDKLKTGLFNLSSSSWNDLINILDDNVSKKNIQIYFFNPTWEKLVQDLNADGEVLNTNQDFLMVVDSNLGAFKSDAVLDKNISYNIKYDKSQGITSNLSLNYQHNGDFNWRTTRYQSYTRIYVPYGSELISSSESGEKKIEVSTFNDQELNKTVFAFYWVTEPGANQEIILKYKLPETIKESINTNNYYELDWQKQAGSRAKTQIIFNYSNIIKQFNPKTDQNIKIDLK